MSAPRVVASIEARMGSSRLPGKILMDICGKPALTRLLSRLRRCRRLDDIVLATSTAPADDVLAAWSQENACRMYRGSEGDVLARVTEAHKSVGSDIVVEITGDCTLIDPEVIDMGIDTFLHNEADVVSNTWKLSFPMGVDVQVFRFNDLEAIARNVKDPAVREHVSLYFYEHPEHYRIIHMRAPMRWYGPDLRFQLDYPEDLEFIRQIYRRLEPVYGDAFGIEEIMGLLRNEADLKDINKQCEEKAVR